ncbi:DeoR family transcriptional regulator [Streptomyces sp. NPDC048338]|uniref:DeoR family transcriptional regulator n=1 Tax=Streptomyces sp. NPDC048338 TaxID=3365536 RepID=UPI003719A8DE
MTTPTELAERRSRVASLAQDGESNRRIAAQLGVAEATVRRDLAHLAQQADATPTQTDAPCATEGDAPATHPDAPAPTRAALLADRLATRATHTDAAVRHAHDAATACAALRPAYVMTDPATAARWYAQLRDAATQLKRQADAFADYYPFARRTQADAPDAADAQCATEGDHT